MPWKRGHSPLAAIPDYENYFFEQWERSTFDDYWKVPALNAAGHYARMPKVPSVHVSGWYDPYARNAVENFAGLAALGHPAQLVIGPWTHGSRSRTYAGDVDFGREASFDGAIAEDFVAWRLGYFARHLKGAPGPTEPSVRFFVMGGGSGRRTAEGRLDHGGRWRTARRWPPEDGAEYRLHLHPDGRLLPVPPAVAGRRSYRADPDRPVPTIGGPITSGEPVMVGGAFDQRERPDFFGCRPPYFPLVSRPDVLAFETPPLADEVTLAGDVELRLSVSSDRPTTDFTAKLVDVQPPSPDFPEGVAMNLCDGILRACYRNGFERAASLVPGEVAAIRVELYPTANRFLPGHRIRLEVASSNFPRFDVGPNFAPGEDLVAARLPALNTLHFGPSHPACLRVHRLRGR